MDLGISSNARDIFFKAVLGSNQKELEKKGIVLDFKNIEDQMLL